MPTNFKDVVGRAERTEQVDYVTYDPSSIAVAAVIKGWANLPADTDLSRQLRPGAVVVRREDGEVVIISNEIFRDNFRLVLDVTSDTKVADA